MCVQGKKQQQQKTCFNLGDFYVPWEVKCDTTGQVNKNIDWGLNLQMWVPKIKR